MADYVLIESWHIEAEGDQTHTLCGLTVRAHPDPLSQTEHQANGWAKELPLSDPSCETCLRLRESGRSDRDAGIR